MTSRLFKTYHTVIALRSDGWLLLSHLSCCCSHLKQVIAGHARLAGHTSRDDHQVAALQGICQLIRALETLKVRHKWLSCLRSYNSSRS
jgi:hypothetical protein